MHSVWIVAVVVAATLLTRFLPFLIFRGGKPTPKIITYLGKVLPCAIIGMLVVFCLKDVSFLSQPYGIPELVGCLVVAGLHIWKRNTLLSIGVGTAVYMLIVQFVI